MQIAVLPAGERWPILGHLFQLYLYDLSEIEGHEVGPDGRFSDTPLRALCEEPGTEASLISAGGTPVGFALTSRRSRLRSEFEGHAVAAFFILRRHRRQGLGRRAALLLLDRHPGAWEVATFGQNIPAVAFWRCIADVYTGGRYDESWIEKPHWRGAIQSFATPERP